MKSPRADVSHCFTQFQSHALLYRQSIPLALLLTTICRTSLSHCGTLSSSPHFASTTCQRTRAHNSKTPRALRYMASNATCMPAPGMASARFQVAIAASQLTSSTSTVLISLATRSTFNRSPLCDEFSVPFRQPPRLGYAGCCWRLCFNQPWRWRLARSPRPRLLSSTRHHCAAHTRSPHAALPPPHPTTPQAAPRPPKSSSPTPPTTSPGNYAAFSHTRTHTPSGWQAWKCSKRRWNGRSVVSGTV